jgi:hypothetical protein
MDKEKSKPGALATDFLTTATSSDTGSSEEDDLVETHIEARNEMIRRINETKDNMFIHRYDLFNSYGPQTKTAYDEKQRSLRDEFIDTYKDQVGVMNQRIIRERKELAKFPGLEAAHLQTSREMKSLGKFFRREIHEQLGEVNEKNPIGISIKRKQN